MNGFEFCNVMGWTLLIASWVMNFRSTDKEKSRAHGMLLSGIAIGLFVANLAWMFGK